MKGYKINIFTSVMAKEILFYQPIYSFTVEDYIRELEAAKDTDIKVRMNTPGGDVYAAYGAIAKFNEHKGTKSIHVDGEASSGGAFMCFAAKGSGNEVTCLDVSQFLVHRAAFPSYVESDPKRFTDAMKKEITNMNKGLRAMVERVTTPQKFMDVTGTSLDVVFSLESRVDVMIDANQAMQLGLVSNVMPLTASRKNEIMALAGQYGIAAFSPKSKISNNNSNKTTMTVAEIKAQYPDAYKQICDEAVTAERDRVAAWQTWADIAPKKVRKGIESGAALSTADISELSRKALAKAGVKEVEEGNAPEVKTEDPSNQGAKTEAQKNEEAQIAAWKAELGLDATKKPETVIYSQSAK